MKVRQTYRIKELLARRRDERGRRMTITSLARVLEEPFGTVANNVYGYRRNPEIQAKIATFLEQEVQELFASEARNETAAGPAEISAAAN
ncbi:MAG: hypothetical protein WC443_13090 [Desulfobaccales bacterium]